MSEDPQFVILFRTTYAGKDPYFVTGVVRDLGPPQVTTSLPSISSLQQHMDEDALSATPVYPIDLKGIHVHSDFRLVKDVSGNIGVIDERYEVPDLGKLPVRIISQSNCDEVRLLAPMEYSQIRTVISIGNEPRLRAISK